MPDEPINMPDYANKLLAGPSCEPRRCRDCFGLVGLNGRCTKCSAVYESCEHGSRQDDADEWGAAARLKP